jgi:hypothetical protein
MLLGGDVNASETGLLTIYSTNMIASQKLQVVTITVTNVTLLRTAKQVASSHNLLQFAMIIHVGRSQKLVLP